MLTKIQQYIDSGDKQITIMSNGGNAQVSLKVEIDSFDNVGMVCRVKGMMGGLGEQQCYPWASIAFIKFGW